MNITAFLALAVSLNVSASVYSQQVTINAKDAPLEKLFREIKAQTGYTFVYTETILRKAKPVTLDVHEASIEEALSLCLRGQPFTYQIIDKTIVIKPVDPEAGMDRMKEDADIEIQGVVTDPGGKPLSGVSVTVKGTRIGTQTDINGFFRIRAVNEASVLVFSSIGYESQEITVGDRTSFAVSMKLATSTLSDVVVVGYGTQKRADVTSAISSLSERDIKNTPVAGADLMMQGKIPGVNVVSNSGQPGAGVSIMVRGITTINNNQPLYVIDGVPISISANSPNFNYLGGVNGQTMQSPLATLNPNDIASIDILKDASAQAIYGSAGGNGVILITTKHGRTGEGKFEYDVYYGQQQIQKRLPVMNLRQYATYFNSVVAEGADGGNIDTIGEFKNPELLGPGTSWQDAIFQTGLVQNHQLSFSGGQNKTTYYFSGNYFDQDGILINTGFKRYSGRISIDQQVKSWLNAGINANLQTSEQKLAVTDGQQSVISTMLYNSPATPVKSADGNYVKQVSVGNAAFGDGQNNPVALAQLRDVRSQDYSTNGDIYVNIQFSKDLSLREQLNYNFFFQKNKAFQPNISNPDGTTILSPSKLQIAKNNSYYYGLQSYLTYNHTFGGKHALNVVLGHEASYNLYDGTSAQATNLTLNIPQLSAGSPDGSPSSGTYDGASQSYYGRLTYTYDERYSINLSGRRDGSSSFGPGKRIGYFPAVSAGWTVTNEKFAKNWNGISFLKLRLGVGSVGISSVPQGAYTANINLYSGANGIFGYTSPLGFIANVPNPDVSWESVVTYNAGLDASFINRRIDLTVDVYKKVTTDMIIQTQLPSYAGLGDGAGQIVVQTPYTNAGQMTNTGIDVGITSHNIVGHDFTWNTTAMFSAYKNILDKLNTPGAALFGFSQAFTPVVLTETTPGHAVGQFYGFKTDGLYRSLDELSNGPITDAYPVGLQGTWLGDVRYKDLNGDKVVTDKDQAFIGNPNPKFTYSLTNSFSYKNIDLTIFLNGVYGDQIYNYSRMEDEALYNVYQNQLSTVLDRYTAGTPNGKLPRYNPFNQGNLRISDRFIESGSYLRIQNVSIGYNLPPRVINKAKMSSCRIYISGQNLYTFTKYSGYDPELGAFNTSVENMNIDYGHYPNPRSVTIGANIVF